MMIGFIGQGWIGRHYADDFESRGHQVVRYARSAQYRSNRSAIADCKVVFVAVPTPTTPAGFDASIVEEVLALIGDGNTAVIKSTLLPGTTNALQKRYPGIHVFHSPEFLVEKTAAHDAANPERNIIGIPVESKIARTLAAEVLEMLPKAPYERIMSAIDAEFVKYAGNCFLFSKVVFMNLLFDVVERSGGDFGLVREALAADQRIGRTHMTPVDQSNYDRPTGRGAGGHCFIKDFEAFRRLYADVLADPLGDAVLTSLSEKNLELLKSSQKDLDLVTRVFGE